MKLEAIISSEPSRLLPGALGDPTGALDDSHASGLLEYPHYTRPAEFRGWAVPDVLLSGDHARIARWRREQALRRTFLRRPDMLLQLALSEEDKVFLSKVAEAGTKNPKSQPLEDPWRVTCPLPWRCLKRGKS